MSNPTRTTEIVDHFFRYESSKVITYLVGKFGKENLELVEDCVQEALLKAMKVWPFKGVPDNPSAWLLKVAQNKVLDTVRRSQVLTAKKETISNFSARSSEVNEVTLDTQLHDDYLNMMFACCHPSIMGESQIILVLKILSGFGNREIARALMKSEDAIAKAYTRAKTKLKKSQVKLEIPIGRQLSQRLDIVLKIIYLMFNEGYSSSSSDELVKQDLCYEAMRLTKILADHPLLNHPNVNAILALMCFHASRFNTRTDADGNLQTLDQQDRSKWNKELIEQGGYHLYKSTRFGEESAYFLEARIAACHAMAPSFEETNWKLILTLYDALLEKRPNNITALNRLVALAKVEGADNALICLEEVKADSKENYLLYAIEGFLYEEVGDSKRATESYEKAIFLTQNEAEKNHLVQKLSEIVSV